MTSGVGCVTSANVRKFLFLIIILMPNWVWGQNPVTQDVREFHSAMVLAAAEHRFPFVGHTVRLKGAVRLVQKGEKGLYLALAADDGWANVYCTIRPEDESRAAGLQPGELVTVQGVGVGWTSGVALESCALADGTGSD